ncbi:MAG: hypothetical protein JWN25_1796 [Verrucomicrobiales bacterium]|nr:hypothetical protein [Verrucomicrobiales bacterium]
MAERKDKIVLDWYGNPLPASYGIGICKSDSRLSFKGEIDYDGKKYIRAYTPGGVPGDRIPLEDFRTEIKDEKGKIVYDSHCEPPVDANLLPGYIGYEREKQLKRYFP